MNRKELEMLSRCAQVLFCIHGGAGNQGETSEDLPPAADDGMTKDERDGLFGCVNVLMFLLNEDAKRRQPSRTYGKEARAGVAISAEKIPVSGVLS